MEGYAKEMDFYRSRETYTNNVKKMKGEPRIIVTPWLVKGMRSNFKVFALIKSRSS